jgi:hypothetical protein
MLVLEVPKLCYLDLQMEQITVLQPRYCNVSTLSTKNVLSGLANSTKHCTIAKIVQCWYLKYLNYAIWTCNWSKALYYSQDIAMQALRVPKMCYLDMQIEQSTVL